MDIEFMQLAIKEAKKSGLDIPVGCVIEKGGKVIAAAHNMKEKTNDTSAHAEILAIKKAGDMVSNWRLDGCDLYVTLEPCPMCAWAILSSGIKNVYFGAYDTLYGALGSKINLVEISQKKPTVMGGIMEKETKEMLYDYFDKMRKN